MIDVCAEKHRRVDEKLVECETRLNDHDKKIDVLEQFKSSTSTEIKNLIEQIKTLVSVMKWFLSAMFITYFGFFIWYIQQIGK